MSKVQSSTRTRMRTPNKETTPDFRISDAVWPVLHPLLPVRVHSHRFGGGRPRPPDRLCADAIFYVLRTGCQWHALDQTERVAHATAHERFQEWVEAGVFLNLWRPGVERFDELSGIDWAWLSLDGVMTTAPLGGEKKRTEPHRSRQGGGQAPPVDRGARRAPRDDGGRRQPP